MGGGGGGGGHSSDVGRASGLFYLHLSSFNFKHCYMLELF